MNNSEGVLPMSFEDEVASELEGIRLEQESKLREERELRERQEEERREVGRRVLEFVAYIKQLNFPSVPLYIEVGKVEGGFFSDGYLCYKHFADGWIFEVVKIYRDSYPQWRDVFISIDGSVYESTCFWADSRGDFRGGLPEGVHVTAREVRSADISGLRLIGDNMLRAAANVARGEACESRYEKLDDQHFHKFHIGKISLQVKE
nr:hypothetical protein [Actinomyces oris]